MTQLDLPSASTGWAQIAIVLSEATALLLLLGGVATVVALVPKRLEQTGEHKAESKWTELVARWKRRRRGS